MLYSRLTEKKFDAKARKFVYLGIRTGVKGHLLFDLTTRELIVSRDVIFYENTFPYLHNSPSTDSLQHTTPISPSSYNFLFDQPILFQPPRSQLSSPPTESHQQPASPPIDT